MFWIPLTYLVLSTLVPGPVTILTVHNSVRYGRSAGRAVAMGAMVTSALFVAVALLFTQTENWGPQLHTTAFYQQGGAFFALVLGLAGGYKVLFTSPSAEAATGESRRTLGGFFAGMGLMAPYFPQALLFYTVIVPAHELSTGLAGSILLLGTFKVALTFCWYVSLAHGASAIQAWYFNPQMRRAVELSAASLMLLIGLTLFFH